MSEQVAEAWRHASPAAVHPELDTEGLPTSDASAFNTVTELLAGVNQYHSKSPSELAILDYACGPGRLLAHLQDFRTVIGADTNRDYLEIAETRGTFLLLYVDPTPELLPNVDVIVCVNLFIHIPRTTARSLLALFAQSLNPGGLLALHVPLYEVGREAEHWTAVGTWTDTDLRAEAKTAGLKVLESHQNHGAYEGTPGPYHAALSFLTHA